MKRMLLLRLLCAVLVLCPCQSWPPDEALALAPSSDLSPVVSAIEAESHDREIREFIRQFPLSEGHAHFGGSIDSAVLWRLALKREDIGDAVWDDLSKKVGEVFSKETVDLKAIVREGRRLAADAQMDATVRDRDLERLQGQFKRFTQYIPEDKKSLDDFIKVYLIAGTLSKGSHDIVKGIAKEIALKGYEDGLRLLELRASFAKGSDAAETYCNMLERIEAIHDGLREAEEEINAKLPAGAVGLETRMVMTAEKNNSIQTIMQQTVAFLDVLENRPDLRESVVGFDAANPEKQKAPTEFIPVIQKIKGYNERRGIKGQAKLGLTYHVGEDFSDTTVEGGIRHAQDVIEMGVKRLGHGLVLGVDVGQYLGKTQQEHLGERLAQIYHDLRNAKFDADGLEAVGLKINVAALKEELRVYARAHVVVREDIIPLLGDILVQKTLDLAKQVKLYEVLNKIRNMPGFPMISKTYDAQAIQELVLRQNYALNKVIENDVMIETNPTSNIYIGPVVSYGEHPIRRFLAYRYPKVKGKSWLAGRSPLVSINTDDAGIFGVTTAEEVARIAVAQKLSPEQIKRLIIHGFRHRLSDHPLKFLQQIMATLGSEVQKELLGYAIVATRFGEVQFTVPSETACDVMQKFLEGKTFPTVFVLPPELFVGGNNYADIEFVSYFFIYFVRNGLKITLVLTPEQEMAMQKYLAHSFFGVDFQSSDWKRIRERWVQQLSATNVSAESEVSLVEKSVQAAQEALAGRDANGRVFDMDDFVHFMRFENGVAQVKMRDVKNMQTVLGKIEIRQDKANPTKFTVKEEGVPDAMERIVDVDYSTPYVAGERVPLDKKEAVSELNRPRLGYTVLDRNNGFDVQGGVSSFIVWAGKHGVLVDPSQEALRKIEGLGLGKDDLPYVFLTHNHADHDRGLLKWLFTGHKVTLLTSWPVYFSLRERAQALLGMDIDRVVKFQPLLDGVPADIPLLGSEKATIEIRHNLHPIPTIGFKLKYAYEGKTYGIGFSGDTLYDNSEAGKIAAYKEALQAQGLGEEQIARLMHDLKYFFWDANGRLEEGLTTVIHEVEMRERKDSGKIHTPIVALQELPDETKRAMALYHMAEKNFPVQGYQNVAALETVTVLPSDEQLVQEYRLQQVSLVSLLADLSPEEKRRVVTEGSIRRFQPGEKLITQGSVVALSNPPNGIPANMHQLIKDKTRGDFFVLLSGEAEVERDGKPVYARLGPGAFVGEWSIETGQERGATVKAGETGITAWVLTAEQYMRLLSSPELTARVFAAKENLPFLQALKRAGGQDNFLEELDYSVMIDLAGKARTLIVRDGQILLRKGDAGDAAYIVKTGRFKVLREDGSLIATLLPGDVFGEMALLQEGGKRNATVVADGDSQVLRIGREQFEAIRKNWPHFERVMTVLAQRRAKEMERLAAKEPPVSRYAEILLEKLESVDDGERLHAAEELLERGDVRGLRVLRQLEQTGDSLGQIAHALLGDFSHIVGMQNLDSALADLELSEAMP